MKFIIKLMNQKGFSTLVVVLIISFICLAIIGGVFIYNKNFVQTISDAEKLEAKKALSSTSNESSTPSHDQSKLTEEQRENLNQSFDNNRLDALKSLQKAIEVVQSNKIASERNISFYCNSATDIAATCYGSSIEEPMYETRQINGEGWVKMDLSKYKEIDSVFLLPFDVKNDQKSHFVYCANKDGWEINAILDSKKYKEKLLNDGGDDPNKYEIGSNLKLMDKVSVCKY